MARKSIPLDLLLIVIVSFSCLPRCAEAGAATFPPECVERTLAYEMRGEVRILLFWIGRDEVGGGRISFGCEKTGQEETGEFWQETEVLFGSSPERVPGGVNRWGYGCERALWSVPAEQKASLLSTHFSGVMRHSKEESVSKTLENEQNQKSTSRYWFDAIQSVVLPGNAHSQIHIFSRDEEFDYRYPEKLITELQNLFFSSPPHEKQQLQNRSNLYGSPYGFLTGLASLIEQIVDSSTSQSDNWIDEKPSLIYVYDSKPYRLKVQRIKKPAAHHISSSLSSEGFPEEVPRTAEIQFRIENLTENLRHNFTLWVPLQGSLRSTPLRIMYQPRWWLRIKLDLTSVRD